MDNKKVSIIVPVYNVEKYLDKCITSLINQTYSNIEILLINDGSIDSSLSICNNYASRDERVIVLNKENGGLSSARNYGLDNCKGDYIIFVDSDDWLDINFVEQYYKIMVNTNATLIIGGLINVKTRNYNYNNIDLKYSIISKEDIYKRIFMQDNIDVSACGKMYAKSVFDNIRYPDGLLYEDFYVIDKIIEKSIIIAVTNYLGYYYYQRPGSIMYKKFTEASMVLIKKSDELLDFINKNYPGINNYAIRRYVYNNYHILGRSIISMEYDSYSIYIRNNILKYKGFILNSKLFTKKEKLATKVLSKGLKKYRCFWKLYCIISRKKIK